MNYRTAFILIEETISSSVYTLNFKLIAIQYRKSGFFRGISFRASGRGSFLPLPDHRDTSLISRHCRSMTVARRMPARASTAVALRAYRAKIAQKKEDAAHDMQYPLFLCPLFLNRRDID